MGFNRNFQRFRELPIEVQVMIYQSLIPPTRVVIEYSDDLADGTRGPLRMRLYRPAIPPIALVNQRARETVRIRNQLAFGDIAGGPVYFDFQRDFLDINLTIPAGSNYDGLGFIWPQSASLVRDLNQVRNMRLYWDSSLGHHTERRGRTLFAPLPNVRRLQYQEPVLRALAALGEGRRLWIENFKSTVLPEMLKNVRRGFIDDGTWSVDNVSPAPPTLSWLSKDEIQELLQETFENTQIL